MMNVMNLVNTQWRFPLYCSDCQSEASITVNGEDTVSVELLIYLEDSLSALDCGYSRLLLFDPEENVYFNTITTSSDYGRIMSAEKMFIVDGVHLFLNADPLASFRNAEDPEDEGIDIGSETFYQCTEVKEMPADGIELFKAVLKVAREYALHHFPEENK